ncbi:MAG: DUF1289 domain-containing protein [Beijerinckiaceae bacterium]|nr:DUF1289 domain-containing protein [Beijerinckiaceae bacterium]
MPGGGHRPAPARSRRIEAARVSIPSPCSKVCILDPVSGLCLGCGRTAAEIGGWLRMSDAQRAAIMSSLGRRTPQDHARAPSVHPVSSVEAGETP